MEDKINLEKDSEFPLLVVRAFEVVEVLEGDLLENRVDGLRVEALADVLGRGSVGAGSVHRRAIFSWGLDSRNRARAPISAATRKTVGLWRIRGHAG
nr:hypothetical protein [Candidatus Sigynarchaeota archaeon]